MSIQSVRNDNIGDSSFVNAQIPIPPTISGYTVSGTDDTALDPAGGQTVLINGTGFQRGATITFNGSAIAVVSWVSANQLSFTSPAQSAGTYTVYVVNNDGGTAIYIPGIVYSTLPTWTTSAGSLGSYYETTNISNTLVAAGDAPITYSLVSGSLPAGSTLAGNGVITGTAPVDSGSTTYSFTVEAIDAQLQSSTRSFSLTINTDVVTWVNPGNGASILLDGSAYSSVLSATDAAGYSVSYTANALPTGLTLSDGTISGTPTVVGDTTTLLTATAATTGRTATNTITWTVSLGDIYWDYVTTLLSANSSPSFITDASINNAVLTPAGTVRADNSNPYQLGYYGVNFSANGNYLSTPANAGFNISSPSTMWTFECWVLPYTAGGIFAIGGGGAYDNSFALNWGLSTANKFNFSQGTGAGSNINSITSANTFVAGAWYHVAVSKDAAGVIRMFVNGVQEATVTNTSTSVSGGTTAVINGFYDNNGLGNNGGSSIISNLRFVKGAAIYTSAFTPSTAPLTAIYGTMLLACQSNRFIDGSSNDFTLNKGGSPTSVSANPFATVYQAGTQYYSTKFDGTGDYLSLPSNAAFAFGTGAYTMEGWIYVLSAPTYVSTLFDAGGATNAISLGVSAAGAVSIGKYGIGTVLTSSSGDVPAGQWVHVAAVRASTASNDTKLYVNGVLKATGTDNNDWTVTTSPTVGGINVSGYVTNGYISNLRIVKGTAVYTANFTPPTAPLTAISGTSLLTCQDNTIKDNSTNNFALTVVGDAKPTTVHPYMFDPTYYSVGFDGTGDYLTVPANAAFNFGSGDFSIEMWVYPISQSLYGALLSFDAGDYPLVFSWASAVGANIVASAGTNAAWIVDSLSFGTTVKNVWTHLVFTRSGNNWRTFQDGVLRGYASAAGTVGDSTGAVYVGSNGTTGYASGANISNLRIVKGSIPASYVTASTTIGTSIFTPPTAPLTAISGTSLLTCQDSLIIDRSSNVFAITANGNAAPAAVAPFTQPSSYTSNQITTFGSGYFSGSGDYLTSAGQAAYNLGSSTSTPWTVECWMYQFSGKTTNLVSQGAAVWRISMNTNGTVNWLFNTSSVQTSTDAIVFNAWNHIAVTYDGLNTGTSNKLFVNGKLQAAQGQLIPPNDNTTTLYIGRNVDGGTAWDMNGYISDVRIVKGTALYTSNFVPPVNSRLTNVTNTQLLTLQNNNNANNSGFKDSSSFNNLITRNGNTTQGTFSPYGTNWSNYFDGSSNFYTPAGIITASGMGTGFSGNIITIEAWINPITVTGSNTNTAIIGAYAAVAANGRWWFGFNNSGNLIFTYTTGTGSEDNITATGGGLTINQWHHVAVTIDATTNTNTTVNIFLNGTRLVNATAKNFSTQTAYYDRPYIGGNYSQYVNSYTGYISNFRIIKGTAVYNTNFTPSTTPLTAIPGTALLTCTDNTFIDDSVNNFILTRTGNVSVQKFGPFAGTTLPTPYYSAYFDGTGDYLSTSNNAAFNFGTGDFTLELWANHSSVGQIQSMVSNYTGAANGWGLQWRSDTARLDFFLGDTQLIYYTFTPTVNTWYHYAVSRSGTSLKLFVNGAVVATVTDSTSLTSTGSTYIGNINSAISQYTVGYLSNVRITKGQALYTSAFTPSTTPLTAISGTSLLTCQSNTFVDNSTNNFTITATGNAIPKQISPFTLSYSTKQSYTPAVFGGSMYFDGTGDYLNPAINSSQDLIGDFTNEHWCYPLADGTSYTICCGTQPGSGTWRFTINTTTGVVNYAMAITSWAGVDLTSGTGLLKKGAWNHLCATRSGNTFNLYVNGVVAATTSNSGSLINTGRQVQVGYYVESGGTYYFTGYLSDIRLTRGTALYTSNFVPQNAPLTPVKNTTLLVNGTGAGIYDSGQVVNYETVGDARAANFGPYNGSYYSNYFDGTGDYLTLVPGTFGSADFTIEFWYYSNVATGQAFFNNARWYNGYTPASIMIWHDGSTFYFNTYTGGGSDYNYAPGVTISRSVPAPNMWHHISLTRQGGTMYAGIDGVITSGALTSNTGLNLESRTTYNIGAWNENGGGPAYSMSGNISNLRIVKGTALYTANFTPSTTPLTAVSGTSLLTCQSNKFVDNSTNNFTITKNGDTKVATQNPWQNNTGTCMYFDGTGDYLSTREDASLWYFGTSSFTIEAWVNPSARVTNSAYIIGRSQYGVGTDWALWINNTGNLVFYMLTGGSNIVTSTGTVPLNAWTYVTVVRSGTTVKLYINGTNDGTLTGFSSALTASYGPTVIANSSNNSGSTYFNGYISDLRITKGVARYTSSFTPPTAPLSSK